MHNVLGTPFALHLLRDKNDIASPVCANPSVLTNIVKTFHDAMGWNLVAMGASVFVLCFQITHYFQYGGEIERDGGRVIFITGSIIMLGTLISNWVLWSSFAKAAGSYSCPGGVILTGVVWGVVIRPLVGVSGTS